VKGFAMMPNITNLRQENWATITPLERETTLQALADHLAHEEGRTPCNVHAVLMDKNTRGRFSIDAEGVSNIEINRDLVKRDQPYQAVETLCHEDRHAYQFHITQYPELAESEEQLQDWKMSQEGGYIQPEELNFSTYLFQPTEADANRSARDRTDELYEDTFQDQGLYPAFKAEKEQQIADAEEFAEFELGENYKEEARQVVHVKHQAMMTINQGMAIEQGDEEQIGHDKVELLSEDSEEELSDIYKQDLLPVDKSHFTSEALEAMENADRKLAKQEAEMDAKLVEFYKEEDKKSAENKPIKETAQQTVSPTATGGALEEDEDQSQDYDYHSGYGM